jgi:mRNA interferase RelE/StbE
MAYYKVEWRTAAKRELKKLEKPLIAKIINAVDELAKNPFPSGCKKLVSTDHTYRVRVGDYRILYSVFQEQLIVEIVKTGHRREVYK